MDELILVIDKEVNNFGKKYEEDHPKVKKAKRYLDQLKEIRN
jgi:hypothetical protein